MKRPVREIGPLAAMLSGFLLWSGAFLAIYGAQATGCSLGWHTIALVGPLTIQRAVLLGLFAIVLAGHVVLVRRSNAMTAQDDAINAETAGFMRAAASRLALIATVASIISFGGVVWLTAC